MDTPGRSCVQDQSVLAEDDAVFVGFFNDGKRVVVDAHVAQPVAAALEPLFNRDADTDKLCARLLNRKDRGPLRRLP